MSNLQTRDSTEADPLQASPPPPRRGTEDPIINAVGLEYTSPSNQTLLSSVNQLQAQGQGMQGHGSSSGQVS